MAAPRGPSRPDRAVWLVIPLLVLATWFPYRQTFDAPFTLDDSYVLFQVPAVRSLATVWNDVPTRRLGFLTFAINYHFHGHTLFGYHAVNLAIHAAAGLALFGLARRSLRLPGLPATFHQHATPLAAAIALVWLVHPLQTQAVTYIVQRFESLMGLLALVSLYCLVRGATGTRGWPWYLGSLLAAWLGLNSKESLIVLPLVVLAYDRALLADSWHQLWRRRWWLHLGLIVLVAAQIAGSVAAMQVTHDRSAGFGVTGTTPWQYLRTQAGVLCHYLRLAVWPDVLCIDYRWPIAESWREWLPPGLVILLLLGLTVWALCRAPRLGLLGAAFFLLLAVTSSIMPIDDRAVEHRMYLPLAPLAALVVLGAHLACERFVRGPATRRVLLGGLLGAVALALGWRTAERNRDYVEPIRLWSKAVAVNPLNDRALSYLGRLEGERGRFREAEVLLLTAIELNPANSNAPAHLGMLKTSEKKLDEAAQWYETALRMRPNFVKVMILLGDLYLREDRRSEAETLYRRAIERQPWNSEAWRQLGTARIAADDAQGALDALRTALRLQPRDDQATLRLAWVMATAESTAIRAPREALEMAERLAQKTGRRDPLALTVLAAAQASAGHCAQAEATAQVALAQAELAGDEARQTLITSHLVRYRAGETARMSSVLRM